MIKNAIELEGIVVVNKPSGMTSHDVVAKVRKRFNMKRVGHAGTLDPLATGVLVMLLGKATKLFNKFEGFDKAYNATLILGTKTTSADIEGKTIESRDFSSITRQQVEDVLGCFLGDIEQVPPMVSAIKFNGRKLYELAREGIQVNIEPRKIRIDKLQLKGFDSPRVKFYVECSKGTYVRKLAEDIGEKLNNVACIEQIQRTKVGPFIIDEAVDLVDLKEQHIKNLSEIQL